MENSQRARFWLGLNAGFSLFLGAVFLIATGTAAQMIFAGAADWHVISLRLLGAGLIIFGIDLAFLARDRFVTRKMVLAITMMDVGWIVGSALVLAMAGHLFSDAGKAAIVVVALFVGLFALGQYSGSRQMVPALSKASVTSAGAKLVAQVTRPVNAPPEVVWRVMNDHPGYADVADNLSKVEVISGGGIGMQRRCYGPKGENWLETCDLFEDGRAYGFRIHTEAQDYPYPISNLHGEWSVRKLAQGSEFAIHIEAAPKGNLLVQNLFKLAAKRQFRAVLADLADRWAAQMEREART